MTIPKLIREKLDVKAGDYVSLSECSEFPGNDMVCMMKLELKNVRSDGDRH